MDLARGDTRMIIDACIDHGLLRNQCAYVLATAYHETAHTMKPVREYGGEKYLKAKRYYPYVGMGYVQLTWKENYEKAGKRLGVDFVKHPKYLLKPEYAAPILVIGMQEGWFTGKKLSDYMTLRKSDFRQARRIVNGMDRADLIADYAKKFDALLLAAGYGVEKKPVGASKPVPAPAEPPKPQSPSTGTTGGIPGMPGVVHVEKDGTVKPGSAPEQPNRDGPLWRLLFALLGLIWKKGEVTMGPYVRIALRYGVGAVIGYEVGQQLAADPDVIAVSTAAAAAVVGFATEGFYALAKRLGWAT